MCACVYTRQCVCTHMKMYICVHMCECTCVCTCVSVGACACPGPVDSAGGGRDARWPVGPGSGWELVARLGQCEQSPKPWVGATEQERVSTWAPLRACRGAGTGVSQKEVSPQSRGHGTVGVGMQPGPSAALRAQHRLGTAAGATSPTLLAGLGPQAPSRVGRAEQTPRWRG